MTEQQLRAQLFLVLETGESARDRLAAVLAAKTIASVLLVPPPNVTPDAAIIRELVAQVQKHGAAAMINGDARLAREIKADGVHLPPGGVSDYEEARRAVGPSAIVGVHAGKSRHDAMTAGEAGADYVAFGVPSDVQDIESARERRLDLVSWWAEIFEVPCVALDVETPEDAAELARAGADFIGITLGSSISPADAAARVSDIAAALDVATVN